MMNEFEVVELLNGITSNIIANQALFITVLTGYLVIAYTVGAQLTTYQVVFINIAFIIFSISGIQSIAGMMGLMTNYVGEYVQLRDELEVADTVGTHIVRWAVVSVRCLLCLGALVFMWQVRHTGSKEPQ